MPKIYRTPPLKGSHYRNQLRSLPEPLAEDEVESPELQLV
jgi:hypothetical protein